MRTSTIFLALLAAASSAQALTINPKALARYDISFVTCESLFPDMKGHRDEVYLSQWQVKPSAKVTADLAKARSSDLYRTEGELALQAQAAAGPAASSSALSQQCQALRAVYQRSSQGK